MADLRDEHVAPLIAGFPPDDYYLSEQAVREGLARRRPFNVIHGHTGVKADLIPLPRDALSLAAFARRIRRTYDREGHSAVFITAEDVILAKLLAHHQTGSDKHLRDARGVLLMQWTSLDGPTLWRDAQAAGVAERLAPLWEDVRRQMTGVGSAP